MSTAESTLDIILNYISTHADGYYSLDDEEKTIMLGKCDEITEIINTVVESFHSTRGTDKMSFYMRTYKRVYNMAKNLEPSYEHQCIGLCSFIIAFCKTALNTSYLSVDIIDEIKDILMVIGSIKKEIDCAQQENHIFIKKHYINDLFARLVDIGHTVCKLALVTLPVQEAKRYIKNIYKKSKLVQTSLVQKKLELAAEYIVRNCLE